MAIAEEIQSTVSPTSVRAYARDEAGVLGSKNTKTQEHFSEGLDWGAAFWIGMIHIGALAAPWTFTWSGFGTFLALYWLTGGIGICLGFHRLLSHCSFKTYAPVRWFLAFVGGLAGEGSAVHWTATHRIHHAKSDSTDDPHSPREGFLWSHMLWCLQKIGTKNRRAMHERWAPDMLKDPVLRFLDKTFMLWHVLLGLTLYGFGYWIGGTTVAWSMLVWGVFLRMAVVLHATWCINSVTHVWGYKTYDNGDDSKNLWWVALVTFGEGWHNNHHAYQKAANYGHRWWEIDTTYWMIRAMQAIGLAWNVAPIPPKAIAQLQLLKKRR